MRNNLEVPRAVLLGKKAFPCLGAIIKRILLIGFTIQMLLGIAWMCCNFLQVQDLGKIYFSDKGVLPEGEYSSLYHYLFLLLGSVPQLMYLLQLSIAFAAGYYFLGLLVGRRYAVWGSLALITFPFAMQCHLAVLPYSLMGSVALLLFAFLWRLSKGEKLLAVLGVVLCAILAPVLAGWPEAAGRKEAGHSFEAMMASRIAWPTLWNDFDRWPEGLRDITGEVVWEATYYPGNMNLLYEAVEGGTDPATAKEYYKEMAEIAWTYHAPMVIRQMGWDALGYMATPVIFRLQLQGESYDSYTGGNYEAMRGNSPVLARYYVEYGAWWFACGMALTLVLAMLHIRKGENVNWKGLLLILAASGIWVGVVTLRGAGMMDYKYTIAVNELWLAWSVLEMYKDKTKRKSVGNG